MRGMYFSTNLILVNAVNHLLLFIIIIYFFIIITLILNFYFHISSFFLIDLTSFTFACIFIYTNLNYLMTN